MRSILSSHSGKSVGVLLLVFVCVDLEVADLLGDVFFLFVILIVAVGDLLVYLILIARFNHVVLVSKSPAVALPPMRNLGCLVYLRTIRINLTLDNFLNLVFLILLLRNIHLTPLACPTSTS